jgi:2-hydroxychromene-2-carboxylate isomerase
MRPTRRTRSNAAAIRWRRDRLEQACRNRPAHQDEAHHMKPKFLFDFGSPNCYLSHLVIPDIEKRTGIKFELVPILLGGVHKLTNNQSPFYSLRGIRNKPEFQARETQRFLRRHHITQFTANPFFPVITLQLMRCAVAAQLEGVLEPFVEAGYFHMWVEPKKMDDLEIARAAFIGSGIDADRLFARAQDADVKQRLIDLTQSAVDRGAFGAPTFFVGDEMFFGKDQLRDVEEEINAVISRNAVERRAAG